MKSPISADIFQNEDLWRCLPYQNGAGGNEGHLPRPHHDIYSIEDLRLPKQVKTRPATEEDLPVYVQAYCTFFRRNWNDIMAAPFTMVAPDTRNPYRQMYV